MFKAKNFLDNELKGIKSEDAREEFKKIIEEIFGYKWEELQNMNILRVRWLFFNLSNSYPEWADYKMNELNKLRATYLDDNGEFIQQKIIKRIEELKNDSKKTFGCPHDELTVYDYNREGKKLIKAPEIEELFEEIKTYRNYIKSFIDEKDKKIYLTMVEFSMDYYELDRVKYINPAYEEYGIEETGQLRILLTEERYWPKDETIQKQMQDAKVIADQLKSENIELVYYDNFKNLFEYRYGKKNWINYFFNKNPQIKEKYKGYTVENLICITSVVSGNLDLINFKLPVKL